MFTPVTYLEKLVGFKRYEPENQLPGPLMANPDLLPPGGRIFEDGSYTMGGTPPPPPPLPGRVAHPLPPANAPAFLPGLFGGPEPENFRPSTFQPGPPPPPNPLKTYG